MNRIDGTRSTLLRLLADLPARTGAEIGVADGKFSLALCEALPRLCLYCVDPWASYNGNRRGGSDAKHQQQFEQAQTRLAQYDARFLRTFSSSAVHKIADASLDFVFIDANHDVDYVYQDITLWSAKVRSGGIVAGHDYYDFNNSGVIEAVQRYTGENRIEYTVIGDMRKHRDDNANPCWYWVKR